MSTYTPSRYQAASPDSEALGATFVMFTENIRSDVIQPILKKYNLNSIDPMAWYPQQLALDIMRDVEANYTFEELVAIGMRGAETAPIPPEADSIETMLGMFDAMYKISLRNIPPEVGITVNKLGERSYRLICNIPGPAFLMYGAIYGLLKRFREKREYATVFLVEDGPPMVMDVKWELE